MCCSKSDLNLGDANLGRRCRHSQHCILSTMDCDEASFVNHGHYFPLHFSASRAPGEHHLLPSRTPLMPVHLASNARSRTSSRSSHPVMSKAPTTISPAAIVLSQEPRHVPPVPASSRRARLASRRVKKEQQKCRVKQSADRHVFEDSARYQKYRREVREKESRGKKEAKWPDCLEIPYLHGRFCAMLAG